MVNIIARSTKSSAGSVFAYSNKDDDSEDEEEEDEEVALQRVAQTCLDTMAITISSKYFVEPALALCAQVSLSLNIFLCRFLIF